MSKYKQIIKVMACVFMFCCVFSTMNAQAEVKDSKTFTDRNGSIFTEKDTTKEQYKSVILNWQEIPNAAMYELEVLDEATGKVVFEKFNIYAAGYELDADEIAFHNDLKWRVRGLNIDKIPVSDFTEYKPLFDGKIMAKNWQEQQAKSDLFVQQNQPFSKQEYVSYLVDKDVDILPIKITTHFEDMAYMPVYPVYSWIPIKNANKYEISVYFVADKNSDEKTQVAVYESPQNLDFYDEKAYTKAGLYFFNIVAYDINNQKIAQSKNTYFTVKNTDIKVAALGDSITHGGGAVSTPPSATLYNWETYAKVPVLNIGFSGNLTSNMLERFDRDVLSYNPEYLVIMGGVNDIRTGISANTVIANLVKIKDKCILNGIKPIFLTVTPVNPPKMKKVANLDISIGWEKQRNSVNQWIMKQRYHIDVADKMVDERGFLKDDLTTDGLHPDYQGKKHIGEMVGAYLQENFADLQ